MTPIKIIEEYCEKQNIPSIIKQLLIYNYFNDYELAIEKHTDPTQTVTQSINDILLSDNSLSRNVKILQSQMEEYDKEVEKHISFKYRCTKFLYNVMTSAIGSLIFTLLLIIVLFVAENQVKETVNKIFNQDDKIVIVDTKESNGI